MSKIIIAIPTYNEKDNIENIIRGIFSIVPEVYVKIIDDNSPDGTSNIIEGLLKEFTHLSILKRTAKSGLGKAYINAFQEIFKDSSFTHICMMDADFSHDPKYLSQMIKESSGYDVVIGSRYIKDGGTFGWELWRRILSHGGNLYCRIITGIPILDCTGGFNLMKIDTLKRVDFNKFDASGYAFIMELKHSLYKVGAKFKEIPIIFKNRTGGESKISSHIIREGILAPWKLILKK